MILSVLLTASLPITINIKRDLGEARPHRTSFSRLRAFARAEGTSQKGLGSTELYGDVFIIGPDLYPAIKSDSELAKVSSPKVVTVNPDTNVAREMLRIKGETEVGHFAAAMRRYLGDASPLRLRPATSSELAEHWMNIGWDIDEPLLVAEYGSHRIIIDFIEGKVMMIDELRGE